MDIATLVGLILGFIIIVGSIIAGGNAMSFVHLPSLAITGGGMVCSTLIHFSMGQFLGIFSVVKKTLIAKLPAKANLIQNMVNFATINRRDGTLALEPEISKLDNGFFIKGMQMLVDGQDSDTIRDLLEPEIQYLSARHSDGKKILEFMGAAMPAFGMIGTLIGLVQMLQNLSSPDDIGGGMAVALLTTFYGAFFSNLVFIPLAGKLGIYSKEETIVMEMVVEGVCAIAGGDNPTIVREKLQAFVSQGRRVEVKATV
ncbi:motility protein A [Planctomycetota bacterium]